MDKALANSIGTAARRARIAHGYTQEHAAERIGVSVEFYARIERCRSLPSVKTLVRIVEVLDISADVLLGNEPLDPVGALLASAKHAPVRVRRRRVAASPDATAPATGDGDRAASEDRTPAEAGPVSQGEAA